MWSSSQETQEKNSPQDESAGIFTFNTSKKNYLCVCVKHVQWCCLAELGRISEVLQSMENSVEMPRRLILKIFHSLFILILVNIASFLILFDSIFFFFFFFFVSSTNLNLNIYFLQTSKLTMTFK